MVVKRALRSELLTVSDEEFNKLPYWTKVELSHERNKIKGTAHAHKFCVPLVVFHLPSHLYTALFYTIPEVFAAYDWGGLLLWRLLFLFMVLNCAANFCGVLVYHRLFSKKKQLTDNTSVKNNVNNDGSVNNTSSTLNIGAEKNPGGDGDKHVLENNNFEKDIKWNDGFNENDRSVNEFCVEIPIKKETGWTYCEQCETDAPPRAFHCMFCRGCVLKRDHHCFFLGTCIGFWNQRYFVVGSMYSLITGLFGASLCLSFLRASESVTLVGSILPVTLVKWLLGYTSGLICLTTVHLYLNVLFVMLGSGFLTTQLIVISQGLTSYEYKKNAPVKCSSSLGKNLKSVFGDYWAFNFLFPMGFFFQQKGDGLHWDGVKFEG